MSHIMSLPAPIILFKNVVIYITYNIHTCTFQPIRISCSHGMNLVKIDMSSAADSADI